MELLILAFIACPIVGVTVSLAYSQDAASPLGDGIILGFLVMAVPLWPITMPLWVLYIWSRHRDLVEERASRNASWAPATRTPPGVVPYGLPGPSLETPIPETRPGEACIVCASADWEQTSPIRWRFGAVGTSFLCRGCGATRNFDVVAHEWRPTFQTRRPGL